MALISILLVFTALSFGQSSLNDSLYYWGGIINKDGNLVIDFKKIDNSSGIFNVKKISDFKKYSKGDAGDTSFFTIPKADVAGLATSKELKSADYADCLVALEAVATNYYGLIGYGVKAIDGGDIQPSFTAMVKNGPKKIEFKNLPDGYPDIAKQALEQVFSAPQTCEGGFSNIVFGMNHEGVTDAVCHPNTKIPDDTSKCADGNKAKYYLKGYKYANFYSVDTAGLKDLVTRFGPVLVTSGIPTTYYSGTVVLGWDSDGWFLNELAGFGGDPKSRAISSSGSYYGLVLIDSFRVVRTTLSVIAAAVVLPAIALFF